MRFPGVQAFCSIQLLSGPYGIGTIGAESGNSSIFSREPVGLWQSAPRADRLRRLAYQCLSFAGNPNLIDPGWAKAGLASLGSSKHAGLPTLEGGFRLDFHFRRLFWIGSGSVLER